MSANRQISLMISYEDILRFVIQQLFAPRMKIVVTELRFRVQQNILDIYIDSAAPSVTLSLKSSYGAKSEIELSYNEHQAQAKQLFDTLVKLLEV